MTLYIDDRKYPSVIYESNNKRKLSKRLKKEY